MCMTPLFLPVQEIQHYSAVSKEVFSLDDLVVFQMFHLECHDIKHGLITIAQELTDQLVESLADMHKRENER